MIPKRQILTFGRFLEIIKARWGTVAHVVFTFFGLATNIIVSSEYIARHRGREDVANICASDVDPRGISHRHRPNFDEHRRGMFLDPIGRLNIRPGGWYASFLDCRLLTYDRFVRHSPRLCTYGVRYFTHLGLTASCMGAIERRVNRFPCGWECGGIVLDNEV